MPQRTFAKPVEVQITGSILIYDIERSRSAARASRSRRWRRNSPICAASSAKAMCATPSPASACPMWCRSSASTRAPRAAAAGLPRGLSRRRAFPESAARRRRPALAAAHGHLRPASPSGRRQRSPDFSYRPSGDIIANSGSRKQGGRADFTAYSQIRFPLEKAPAFAHSQSFAQSANPTSATERSYPWQDNFCEARSFEVGQCASGFGHQGQDIRAGAVPAAQRRRRALRSQAAGGRRRPRRRRDPLAEAAGGDAADQHPHRAHPLSLHAHEPVQHGCRRRPQRPPRRRRREDRRGLELSRPSQRHHAAICISTCRCSRATAGSGSIPTSR